jgi:hypothetical protein
MGWDRANMIKHPIIINMLGKVKKRSRKVFMQSPWTGEWIVATVVGYDGYTLKSSQWAAIEKN